MQAQRHNLQWLAQSHLEMYLLNHCRFSYEFLFVPVSRIINLFHFLEFLFFENHFKERRFPPFRKMSFLPRSPVSLTGINCENIVKNSDCDYLYDSFWLLGSAAWLSTFYFIPSSGGLKSIGMGLGSGGAPINNFNQMGSSKLSIPLQLNNS